MNKTEQLIEHLRGGYLSNFQMQQLIKCSAADRICRKLRSNPPEGYRMWTVRIEAEGDYPAHNVYKLVKL